MIFKREFSVQNYPQQFIFVLRGDGIIIYINNYSVFSGKLYFLLAFYVVKVKLNH